MVLINSQSQIQYRLCILWKNVLVLKWYRQQLNKILWIEQSIRIWGRYEQWIWCWNMYLSAHPRPGQNGQNYWKITLLWLIPLQQCKHRLKPIKLANFRTVIQIDVHYLEEQRLRILYFIAFMNFQWKNTDQQTTFMMWLKMFTLDL